MPEPRGVHGLLATGTWPNLAEFHIGVGALLNRHDKRRDTVHYTCMAEHLELAKQAAMQSDVTLQEIVTVGTRNRVRKNLGNGATVTVSDNIEEYWVLHLGSHGMKWEA